MRLGVSLATFAAATQTTNVVDRAVELGTHAERLGLDSMWFAQIASYDAIAVASAVGRAVPRISVGTAGAWPAFSARLPDSACCSRSRSTSLGLQ